MGVQPAAEGEDMELVELGDLLQEVLTVRPQTGVEHGLAAAQLKVEDSLQERDGQASLNAGVKHGTEERRIT